MHYSQYFWGIFYLCNLLIVSISLGTLTLFKPRLLNVPRLSRFLVGFCSTPFVLACWMLLMSELPIAIPRLLFILIPLAISIVVILKYRKRYRTILSSEIAIITSNFKTSNLIKIIYISTGIIFLIVIFKMYINSLSPVIANDAAQYLSEALKYCKTLSTDSINTFRGWPDGTLRGNIHNFIWPAYVSHALITTDMSSLGYPYDFAARLAFQITILYMLLSLIALSGLIRQKGVSALSILVLLLVPNFEYVTSDLSRDAFRIIPLLLLTTVLIGSTYQVRIYRKFGKYLLLPFIAGYFAVGGHMLSILPMSSIIIAWLICVLKPGKLTQKYNFRYLAIALAVAIGTLIGGNQLIQAYIETESIVGDAVYNDKAIAGTPLEKEYIKVQEGRLLGTNNTLERLKVIISRDHYILSVVGVFTALITFFRFRLHITKNKKNPLCIISLIVLINALTISDLFSWAGFSLTKWYVMNERYQLHFYPFAAVCIAAFMLGLYGSCLKKPLENKDIILRKALLTLPIVLILFFSIKTVANVWVHRDPAIFTDRLHQIISPTKAAITEHSIQNILLDDMRYNYYLGSNAILMYTKPTWPIIKATNAEQLRNEFRSLDIQLVVLTQTGIKTYWEKIHLYKYLEEPENSEILCDNDYIKIYLLK